MRAVHGDFIFMDPAYADMRQCLKLLERIAEQSIAERLLALRGMLIVEHGVKEKVPEEVGVVHRTRILKQGDSALSFFGWAEAAAENTTAE